MAVLLVGIAAAAHQGWSANLFTLSSDMFPRHAVGSVVGFGGMAGAVGGMLIAKLTGYILETTGSYVPVFIIAGSPISSRWASCICWRRGSRRLRSDRRDYFAVAPVTARIIPSDLLKM